MGTTEVLFRHLLKITPLGKFNTSSIFYRTISRTGILENQRCFQFRGSASSRQDDNSSDLSKTARDTTHAHAICVIAGGKYTTFRKMAEDVASWANIEKIAPTYLV